MTVASNLPDGDVAGSGGENTRNATVSRERQNFEVSETRRERVVPPGQVRRISVAVMVDGVTVPGADGQPQWTARPAEEIETLRALVQSVVGFDAARGDTVTIESLQFTAPPDQGSLAEDASGDWLTENGARLAQIGVLGLIVLALIFFVLRPMLSRRPTPALADLTGPLALGFPDRREGAAEAEGPVLDLPAVSPTKIEHLREVIASRNEESAAVLRGWIEAPETPRETAKP